MVDRKKNPEDVPLKKGRVTGSLWRCGLHPLCAGSKLGPSLLPALHCLGGNFLDCITLLQGCNTLSPNHAVPEPSRNRIRSRVSVCVELLKQSVTSNNRKSHSDHHHSLDQITHISSSQPFRIYL